MLAQVDAGSSSIGSNSGITRRIPVSAYHNFELRIPALGGGFYGFQANNALNIDPAQYDAKDASLMVPRLKLQTRWDGAASSISPWFINLPKAA